MEKQLILKNKQENIFQKNEKYFFCTEQPPGLPPWR